MKRLGFLVDLNGLNTNCEQDDESGEYEVDKGGNIIAIAADRALERIAMRRLKAVLSGRDALVLNGLGTGHGLFTYHLVCESR